jgi:hypothetical protein
MEFKINVEQLFNCDSDGIGILRADTINKSNLKIISSILDEIGNYSAKVKFIFNN